LVRTRVQSSLVDEKLGKLLLLLVDLVEVGLAGLLLLLLELVETARHLDVTVRRLVESLLGVNLSLLGNVLDAVLEALQVLKQYPVVPLGRTNATQTQFVLLSGRRSC